MPNELDPRIPGCCGSVLAPCSKEPMARRLVRILCRLNVQYPSLFQYVDLWRLMVVSGGSETYKDKKEEKWVRIAEGVLIAVTDKSERFYQADVGVLFGVRRDLWLPDYYDLQPGDHVEFPQAQAARIEDIISQLGITFAKVDRTKTRFVRPANSEPTYRIIGMCARIA